MTDWIEIDPTVPPMDCNRVIDCGPLGLAMIMEMKIEDRYGHKRHYVKIKFERRLMQYQFMGKEQR